MKKPTNIEIGHSDRSLLFLMCAAQMLCMPGFTAYAALLPTFRSEWGLTNLQAGEISGAVFLSYGLSVPILTALTDRIDAKNVYVVSAIAAFLSSLMFSLIVDGFYGALISQCAFGIGFAGVNMPGLRILTERLAPEQHRRAVSLYTSLSGIGLGAAYFFSGIISEHFGWRWAFGACAIFCLIAGGIVQLFVVRKPPVCTIKSHSGRELCAVFKNRKAMSYISGYACHCWELFGLRAWMVAFLTFSAPNLDKMIGASGLAAIISLVGSVSNIGTSEISKKYGRIKTIQMAMALTLALGVITGFSWHLSSLAVVGCLLIYYGLVMSDSGLLTSGTIAFANEGSRGMTLGVHSMMGFTSAMISPAIFGFVLDSTGGANNGSAWSLAFFALAFPAFLGVLLMKLICRDEFIQEKPE